MILAVDVGGTNTRIGLFEPATPRPREAISTTLPTRSFPDLPSLLRAFLERESVQSSAIDRACIGAAGPVVDQTVQLTNVSWTVDARLVASALGLARVRLINDLVAMAYSIPVLEESELHTLQRGDPHPNGNVVLVAAGTGLGISVLHNLDGRLIPSPSEGGHADFAARTEREIALVRALTARVGRVEIEQVVSGSGIVNIHEVVHTGPCGAAIDLDKPTAPADITAAAVAGTCASCSETLEAFVEAYGALAGNLVLTAAATGGAYIGGGIAPKILPSLTTGTFLKAFCAKAPMESFLEAVPVKVILNDEAGLIGASVAAQA